jgi:hypothetical protein
MSNPVPARGLAGFAGVKDFSLSPFYGLREKWLKVHRLE